MANDVMLALLAGLAAWRAVAELTGDVHAHS
jgi:hypothetical protein